MSSDYLKTVVARKRLEVTERSSAVPIERLKQTIEELGRPRNFFHAVNKPPRPGRAVNVIAEIKKSSPSGGMIRADFDPVSIAREYLAAGVDALSVLTDGPDFGGRLEYIHAVRDAVKLPVLRKDFIVDPYQVYESRAAGADAILLIAECLDTGELIDLQILATELSLTCLIEIHDIDNLMRVRDHVIGFPHRSYSLLGINNRDLRTLTTSLSTSLRLAELVDDKGVLVSESGISEPEQVAKLVAVGIRSVLVGESLLRSPDIANAVAALFSTGKPN